MTEKSKTIEYTRRMADMHKEDRPREKALAHGMETLSNAELLAILIGSGTKGESVVDLAQRILHATGNRLSELSKRSVKNLTKSFKGIGEARAITLLAAIELGKRFREEEIATDVPVANDPSAVYRLMRDQLAMLPHEEFWVIYLNNAKRVISKRRISIGGVSATVADPKIILQQALEYLASALILVHNHPSGTLSPSRQDDSLTEKIRQGAKFLDIDVVDHLIISENGYYSYAGEGRL